MFYPYRTPKIPGKEGKNARKNKEILARRKNKEIQKKQGKEGQGVVFLGGWTGSPENVSCSSATPDLHRYNLGVALEQETFSRLPSHTPKRLLAPSPIDLGAIRVYGVCNRKPGGGIAPS